MTKFLVLADIATEAYSTENTLFGIFDSKEEAIQWILNNPLYERPNGWDECQFFDFFEYYEEEKVIDIYEHRGEVTPFGRPRKTKIGERTLSKEEYAEKYIKEFNGSPICVGWYQE